MFSKLKKKLNIQKMDDKGAAIVIAIVAIAFIGMLVGMLVYMTYYNYLMKHIDKRNKDNFYSAEYALDILNAGLQQDISDSMSEAYVKALKNSSNMDAEQMTIKFKDYYIANLKAKVADAGNTNKWDDGHLTAMWANADLICTTTPGQTGAYLGIAGTGTGNDLVLTNKDYYTLKNLRIVYTNPDGYISIIETDIRLKVPDVNFAQSAAKLNLEQYSLVANTSLINDAGNKDDMPEGFGSISKGRSDFQVSGSVYGGKKGIKIGNEGLIQFIEDPTDKTNFDLSGETAESKKIRYNLIAKSFDIEGSASALSGMDINKQFNTYVEDINVSSSRFTGDGNMYVGDDMDIEGRNSIITLKGSYRGYGNNNTIAKGSSAILINGANTTLDFSRLNELVLSGHAYVGAKKYDADKDRLAMGGVFNKDTAYAGGQLDTEINNKLLKSDKIEDAETFDNQYEEMLASTEYEVRTNRRLLNGDEIIPQNTSDVLMGESMSVKANQLLYMVPGECIGYYRGSENQVIAKNPMTFEEYDKLLNTPDKDSVAYKQLEEEFLNSPTHVPGTEFDISKVNNAPRDAFKYEPVRLSVLWKKMGTVSFTDNYKVVYRRINGTVMVYLYMDFSADENLANEFYRAYYDYAKDSVDTYVKSYIREVRWNSSLGSQLTLAGNMFFLSRLGEVVLVEDTNQDSSKYLKMTLWQEKYTNEHTAFMHTLKSDYDAMTSAQLTTDVFGNLIDDAVLASMSTMDFKTPIDPTDPSKISAVLATSDVLYPSANCPENTALIISGGDVYVNKAFDGLILAKGNIYICSLCPKVTYNSDKVVKAMQLEYTDPVLNKTSHVYDVLGASGEISYGLVTPSAESGAVKLTDLITYQNWKKE